MNLFEINSAIANFDFQVDELTGELTNADELDALQMARDEKIENIALYIKELDAEQAAIKEEINSLKARQTSKENKAYSLRQYLKDALNGQKFETARCAISYHKSKQVVLAEEFEEWAAKNAPDLLTSTTTVKPDKTAIKAAIKEGRKLQGATLVENQNLLVK